MSKICKVCGCTENNACYHPEYGFCYWTMLALSSMLHFSRRTLESIAESMDDGKNLNMTCGIHLKSAASIYEERYKWMRLTPKKWFGESGNPFTETNKKWRDAGRKIIKNATGIDL